jgi:small subunit ribosomal protein S1
MLAQKWKSGGGGTSAVADVPRSGQIRSFKISGIDATAKKVEIEFA